MNPTLYNAVMEGKFDVLCQYSDQQLHTEATYNKNTVLHVAAQFGQFQCVEKILATCPSLLTFVNLKSETPLHIAAREGYPDIVHIMIECAKNLEQEDSESGRGATKKDILRATNGDKDTALHMAVRNYHFDKNKYLEVVKLITKEDAEFESPANNAGETPLYLAAEQGEQGVDVLSALLPTCKSSAAYGPVGRTALHAATLKDWKGRSTRKLLDWKADLINEADPRGWTPLHYAAYIGNEIATKELLETDHSVAFIAKPDEEDGNTAFHIAAAHGQVDVMKMLLFYSPDCWEIVNFKGQNALHVAVDTKGEMVIEFILNKSWLRHLINQKDNEGNTPIHLLAASEDIAEELWDHNRAERHAFNNKNMTPEDLKSPNSKKTGRIIDNNHKDVIVKCKKMRRDEKVKMRMHREALTKKKNEEADRMAKMGESHMIVAALIATITFTAAYAIPGGYDGNQGRDQGMAVLSKIVAFRAFAITNTIAIACSVSSLLFYIAGGFLLVESGNVIPLANAYLKGFQLTLISLVAMILAFISASFAVLAHSTALPIAMCTISCAPLVLILWPFANCCENKVKEYIRKS